MYLSALRKFLGEGAGESFVTFDRVGEGGGAGAGAGAGAGSGGSGSGAGAGAGAGAAAPIVLSGESLVDFGDGKPVKWSEASDPDKGRYVTRDRYDRGVQYLQTEAARLQAKWDEYHAGTGARPSKPEPAKTGVDPLANIRDLPVISGREISELYQQLQTNGFGPMAQVVSAMANRLKQLEGNVGNMGKGVGALTEREQSQEFENFITKSFSDVGAVKGVPDGVSLDGADPYLREAAKDLYLSHDPDSWKPGEFQKQLASRVSSMVAFVRGLDKKAVEAAQGKKRVWLNPSRGNAKPEGAPGYQHKKGADIARMFFEAAPQGT